MVDGADNQPNSGSPAEVDRSSAPPVPRDKPAGFDFKLRLGSREETNAQLSGRATGELVQLHAIDWDSLTAPPEEAPRSYQTDGDLQSIIVELANQIAGPETGSNPVVNGAGMSKPAVNSPVVNTTRPATKDTASPRATSPRTAPAVPVLSFGAVAPLADRVDRSERAAQSSSHDEPSTNADAIDDAQTAPNASLAVGNAGEIGAIEAPVEAPVDETVGSTDEAALAAATAAAVAAAAARAAIVEAPVVPVAPAPAPVPTPAPVPAMVEPTPAPIEPAPAPPAPPAPPAAQVHFVPAESLLAATAAPAAVAPAAPVQPLSLARIERRPDANRPTTAVDFHALLGQAGLQAPAVRRRKKRHPFRVMFKLIVLLGILGAGLYFGKIYVLDKRWDTELKPFAEAVSAERQLEWKRSVKVEQLPASEYAVKLATGWLGTTEAELDSTAAEWRAMGLAEGRIEPSLIGSGAMSSRPVFYDPTDGMIYELEDTPDDLRELAMDRALTMALLDQHFGWSTELAGLAPAEQIAMRALFDGDALSTAMAIIDPSEADSADLVEQVNRIVVDHAEDAVGAPRYAVDLVGAAGGTAEFFDAADGAAGRDELLRSNVRSDAGMFDAARGLEYRPDDLGGELTESRGMLYWYYVLAGRLEPAVAWDAALTWDGDRVVVSETANGVCVEATIATIDEVGRLRMLDALRQWAAAGPVEAAATVTEIGAEQITVFSCDPGPQFDTVLKDQIPTFGESTGELSVIGDLGANDDAERACAVNAIRGFDVLGIIATGDQAQITPALDGIRTACVG